MMLNAELSNSGTAARNDGSLSVPSVRLHPFVLSDLCLSDKSQQFPCIVFR